jgi:ubiquinone/menaquinone biosynthesis C-methylase UbiE
MAAAYIFHTARISLVIQGCRHVVDLACGPATQLCHVAQLHPHISFTGIDLSEVMLANAERHVRELGLSNVQFAAGDITRLDRFAGASVDGVISTVALHHLPNFDSLRATFREIARILRPGGALYLADFGRLKSEGSVRFFAYKDRDVQPELFCKDYENSLRAAFLYDEFERLAREELPAQARVHRTFLTPFFTLIKTADRDMPAATRESLKRMRSELSPRFRADLDDLRQFFRLGGLPNDPFC